MSDFSLSLNIFLGNISSDNHSFIINFVDNRENNRSRQFSAAYPPIACLVAEVFLAGRRGQDGGGGVCNLSPPTPAFGNKKYGGQIGGGRLIIVGSR